MRGVSDSAARRRGNDDLSSSLPVIVAEFDKNSREKIRITLDRFAGKDTIDVRIWYRDGDQIKPTRQGITTTVSNLATLAAGLTLALDKARELGLVD